VGRERELRGRLGGEGAWGLRGRLGGEGEGGLRGRLGGGREWRGCRGCRGVWVGRGRESEGGRVLGRLVEGCGII
jgi:hypothetical protein